MFWKANSYSVVEQEKVHAHTKCVNPIKMNTKVDVNSN